MDQRILVVDDDATIRQLLGHLLAEEYSVQLAQEGKMALAMAASYKPDLILLDMWMPVMNGHDFIKAYEQIAPQTPIILMSAAENQIPDDVLKSVVAFIAKPFSIESILHGVKKHLA